MRLEVVKERTADVVCELVRRCRRDRGELLAKARACAELRRDDRLGRGVLVQEGERPDLSLEPRREASHGANPRVLERVNLRCEEDVQAENRFREGREREADDVSPILDPKADGQADPLFGELVAARS
jgi:hypothetical protein